MTLLHKAAILTGASRGLGYAILIRLLLEGANVVICARDEAAIDQARQNALNGGLGDRVVAMPADVSDEAQAEAVVDACVQHFGRVDILINNAGAHGAIGPLDEVPLDAWKRAVETNLYGAVHMIRAVLPHMRSQGRGKIVNLSGGGATSPRPFFSAYAASKAALVRLTETLALELSGTGIEVNAVAPGAMNTRLLEEILAAGEAAGSEYAKAAVQRMAGGVPPETAAALCVYLAGPDSDGISGRLLSALWDDWEHLGERAEELRESDIYTLRRIVPEDRGKHWDP